jgi:hypothetical protein
MLSVNPHFQTVNIRNQDRSVAYRNNSTEVIDVHLCIQPALTAEIEQFADLHNKVDTDAYRQFPSRPTSGTTSFSQFRDQYLTTYGIVLLSKSSGCGR